MSILCCLVSTQCASQQGFLYLSAMAAVTVLDAGPNELRSHTQLEIKAIVDDDLIFKDEAV